MVLSENLQAFLDTTFHENSILEWTIAAAITLIAFVVLVAVRSLVRRQLARASESERFRGRFALELAVGLVRRVSLLFLMVISLYLGTYYVALPGKLAALLDAILSIAIFAQFAALAGYALGVWIDAHGRRARQRDPAAATALGVTKFLGLVVIWSIALLMALDNLGFDITTLVAGLGIGGVAIAFALQNILGDIFASVSIILDKPFEVGDFIVVGDVLGTVERIGVKTVRLRSLSGELIVVANNDLLQSRVRNYQKMQERRVVFALGVTYQTPPDKLERIPALIREAIEAQDDTRFDRAHFRTFGDFALLFEAVYYVLRPDYNMMMDRQQAINLAIARSFGDEGIDFAYPTQTIYLNKPEGEPAAS